MTTRRLMGSPSEAMLHVCCVGLLSGDYVPRGTPLSVLRSPITAEAILRTCNPIVNQSSQEIFWKAIFMIEFEPNEPGNLCGHGTAIIASAVKLKTEHGKGCPVK